MRRRAFCLSPLLWPAAARVARCAPNDTLSVAYQAAGGVAWPLYIAQDGGHYAKYGLKVRLDLVPYPGAIAMLVHDEATLTVTALQQVLPTQISDHSLKAVGCWMNRSTFALIARGDVESIGALKGKKIAVSQIGDSTYGYLLSILDKFGLSTKDVAMIPVGANAAGRAAALSSGRVDATLLTAPATFRMEDAGYRSLANFADFDDIYTSAACWVTEKQLASNGHLVERLIQAHAEAVHRFYSDRDFAIRAYANYEKQSTPADVARSWELFNKSNIFERIPYVLKGAVAAAVNQTSAVGVSPLARVTPASFRAAVDNGVIDRLIKDGFFLNLFGPAIKPELERKASEAFR